MWPLEITSISYFTHAANLPLTRVPEWRKYGGGLRLRLRATAGVFRSWRWDLRLFCSGNDDVAFRLHEGWPSHAGCLVLPANDSAAVQVLAAIGAVG
jgi:type VI secretion system protein ImpG